MEGLELDVETSHTEEGGAVGITERPGTLQPIRLASCKARCSGVMVELSVTVSAASELP